MENEHIKNTFEDLTDEHYNENEGWRKLKPILPRNKPQFLVYKTLGLAASLIIVAALAFFLLNNKKQNNPVSVVQDKNTSPILVQPDVLLKKDPVVKAKVPLQNPKNQQSLAIVKRHSQVEKKEPAALPIVVDKDRETREINNNPEQLARQTDFKEPDKSKPVKTNSISTISPEEAQALLSKLTESPKENRFRVSLHAPKMTDAIEKSSSGVALINF